MWNVLYKIYENTLRSVCDSERMHKITTVFFEEIDNVTKFYTIFLLKMCDKGQHIDALLGQLCDVTYILTITLANKEKTLEQQLPDLCLQTLLYTFLVSVSPEIIQFLQKVVLKLRKS